MVPLCAWYPIKNRCFEINWGIPVLLRTGIPVDFLQGFQFQVQGFPYLTVRFTCKTVQFCTVLYSSVQETCTENLYSPVQSCTGNLYLNMDSLFKQYVFLIKPVLTQYSTVFNKGINTESTGFPVL